MKIKIIFSSQSSALLKSEFPKGITTFGFFIPRQHEILKNIFKLKTGIIILILVYNLALKIEAITFVIFSLQLYTLCPKLWNLCSHLYLSWDKFLSRIYCSLKICISNKRKLTQRTSTSTLCSCSKVFDSVCLTCWNIYFGKLLVFNIYHTLGFEISIEFNLQMF